MSKAEELLNTLAITETTNARLSTTDEPHLVIGPDRVITVPIELKRLAVQFDHNVETVTFDCPRYWDEHDMSQMNIYINYLRPDKESAMFKAQNIVVDETDPSVMHFDWTISRNVSEVPGQLVFLVCIKKADEEGNEKTHWNSELCKTCYISEGLEIDGEELKQLYPDIIEQWYQEVTAVIDEVNTTKQDLISDVNTAKQELTSEIAGLKQELLDARDSGELDGATFTPSVSSTGDLSWTNDRGRDNPATVNVRGPDGISPTITVTNINGGYRLTITDINGTRTIDVMDTIIDSSEAVKKVLSDFVYIGTEEPSTGPVLWFETIIPNDYVYTEYENVAFTQLKDSVSQLYSRVEELENNSGTGSGSGSNSDPNVEIDANSVGICNTFDGGVLEFTSDT